MQETRDVGSIPGSGRYPEGGNGNALQYSCLKNPMERGSWWATVHGGLKESDATERLRTRTHKCTHTHTHTHTCMRARADGRGDVRRLWSGPGLQTERLWPFCVVCFPSVSRVETTVKLLNIRQVIQLWVKNFGWRINKMKIKQFSKSLLEVFSSLSNFL